MHSAANHWVELPSTGHFYLAKQVENNTHRSQTAQIHIWDPPFTGCGHYASCLTSLGILSSSVNGEIFMIL